jgi:hypothetical protein
MVEKEHQSEFIRLHDEALVRLRAGVNRSGYLSRFRAMTLPSFEDSCAYEILLAARARPVPSSNMAPAIAVRKVWRRSIDVEKFRDPVARLKHGFGPLEPTIQEVQVDIPLEPVNKLLSKARAVTIPAHIVDDRIVLDGTNYELVLGGGVFKSCFKWWSDAPTDWVPLSIIFAEIRSLVDDAIVARG